MLRLNTTYSCLVGGVSLSRLPPGFGPALRVNPKMAGFAKITKAAAAERLAVVSLAGLDAGPKPGGGLERPTPPRTEM